MNLHREASFTQQNDDHQLLLGCRHRRTPPNRQGREKRPKDGAYAAFTKPGFAYARFPLKASPKQIREANHLMLQQGYYYLRLFGVKYRRQIAACLGQNPTFSRIEQQLGMNPNFRRGDSFVTAYISGPFRPTSPNRGRKTASTLEPSAASTAACQSGLARHSHLCSRPLPSPRRWP